MNLHEQISQLDQEIARVVEQQNKIEEMINKLKLKI